MTTTTPDEGFDATGDCVRLAIDARVATILLERPAKLNALTLAMLDRLDGVCAALAADERVRVVVVGSSSERAFCAGADVGEWSALTPGAMWRRWIAEGHRVFDRLASLPMPSIAVIDAMAYGGGLELALACDLRVASDRARFALPEVRIGIVPGWGGAARLAALVGAARAKQMALTGEPIDATTALGWGLVNEVVEGGPARLRARVEALADSIAAQPRTAVQVTKQLIDGASGGAPPAILDALAAGFVAGTDDLREGVAAFRERRPPRFGD
jgi:enoyl-CoA hydratase/carnithine racemase